MGQIEKWYQKNNNKIIFFLFNQFTHLSEVPAIVAIGLGTGQTGNTLL